MTTDNRTNEPNQNETKSGQTFCFTEAQVEAAAKAYPRWIVDHDGPETPWEQESDALKNEYRAMMRAALVAAAGAAPQAEGDDSPTPGNHAPVLPSSTVDEGKLAEVIRNEMNRIRELYPLEDMDAAPIARAVAEWLREQGR